MLKSRGTWLAIGLGMGIIMGMNLAGLWPQMAIHASATHGQDNFAICTASVDADNEAIYLLDYSTGELKAAVLNNNTRSFTSLYSYNVGKDFGTVKNPKYLIVSGNAKLKQQVAVPIGTGVIYIAEVTSGQLACYGLPLNPGQQGMAAVLMPAFVPLDKFRFRAIFCGKGKE